jgi:hypothetical protein
MRQQKVDDKQQLVERIRRVWADVPYPGDKNIFTPDSYDDEGITEYFAGTNWEGHSVENLRTRCSAISTFFTSAAYQYWLAAYLIAAVESPDELSQGIDSLVFSVAPSGKPNWHKTEQQHRLDLLTDEQKRVFISVLEHLASLGYMNKDAQNALKRLYGSTSYA